MPTELRGYSSSCGGGALWTYPSPRGLAQRRQLDSPLSGVARKVRDLYARTSRGPLLLPERGVMEHQWPLNDTNLHDPSHLHYTVKACVGTA